MWKIKFIVDHEEFKTGDILECDEMGLPLFYCDKKVAIRIS